MGCHWVQYTLASWNWGHLIWPWRSYCWFWDVATCSTLNHMSQLYEKWGWNEVEWLSSPWTKSPRVGRVTIGLTNRNPSVVTARYCGGSRGVVSGETQVDLFIRAKVSRYPIGLWWWLRLVIWLSSPVTLTALYSTDFQLLSWEPFKCPAHLSIFHAPNTHDSNTKIINSSSRGKVNSNH